MYHTLRWQRPQNFVNVVPRSEFQKTVDNLSGRIVRGNPPQVEYLNRYLEQLGVETLVIEHHYVDRNYIEEVGFYYSRCLSQPKNSCARAHAFSIPFSAADFDSLLSRAANGELKEVEEELQKAYQGFIVIRPLPSVPIGRTVLRPQTEENSRVFSTIRSYRVHFCGLDLTVEGLGFQQQDLAVAACATTALWATFQKVFNLDGSRSPTTSAITQAAVRHFLPYGRPFPSTEYGLTIEQICESIRSFDYGPEVFQVGDSPLKFKIILNSYLRSGFPVILAIETPFAGHAVTVVGFREEQRFAEKMPTVDFDALCLNSGFQQIYIHDDRLGPYARANLFISEDEKGPNLGLKIDLPNAEPENSIVRHAIVPLYPKIRCSSEGLLEESAQFFPLVASVLAKGNNMGVEFFFDRAGSYLRSLNLMPVDGDRFLKFRKTAALSRYIGICRWSINGKPLLDSVWDTTDTVRQSPLREHLLALIGFQDAAFEEIEKLSRSLGITEG